MNKAVWLLVIFLLSACSFGEKKSHSCQPPDDFTESDLVGTWWAGNSGYPERSDTLTIKGDGTYKQIIHLKEENYDYESDWQPWRIVTSESGAIFAHLVGMRLYAYNPNLIEDEVVGGGDALFVDFCTVEILKPGGKKIYRGTQMPPGEGVLIVMRDPSIIDRAPGDFFLALLPVSDASSWSYELIAP